MPTGAMGENADKRENPDIALALQHTLNAILGFPTAGVNRNQGWLAGCISASVWHHAGPQWAIRLRGTTASDAIGSKALHAKMCAVPACFDSIHQQIEIPETGKS
jgi:hypothetical protein